MSEELHKVEKVYKEVIKDKKGFPREQLVENLITFSCFAHDLLYFIKKLGLLQEFYNDYPIWKIQAKKVLELVKNEEVDNSE